MYIGLWLLSAGHVSILLHPHCTPGPSYKKVVTREDGLTNRLSPSLANACNPLLQAHPPWAQDNTSHGSPFFPLVFYLAPTHLGWDTHRQFTRRSRDPPGSKRRQVAHRTVRCAIRQQPPPTVLLVVGAINTPNHHTSMYPSFQPSNLIQEL
jgi:hypothetical protein